MLNKYLVAFSDLMMPKAWLKSFNGTSIEAVQDKVKDYLQENWQWSDSDSYLWNLDYHDFTKELLCKYDIAVGDIEDSETL